MLIYIFRRMQIVGLGERVYIVVGTEVATWQTRVLDVTEADFMTPNIHGHLICVYTSCALSHAVLEDVYAYLFPLVRPSVSAEQILIKFVIEDFVDIY